MRWQNPALQVPAHDTPRHSQPQKTWGIFYSLPLYKKIIKNSFSFGFSSSLVVFLTLLDPPRCLFDVFAFGQNHTPHFRDELITL